MTEQVTTYPDEPLPAVELPHPADRHIATAISYAAIDDWIEMRSLLEKEIPPHIDPVVLNKAFLYMMLAHNEPREHREGVNFLVHPLAVARLTIATFGDATTTDQIAVALLHDVIEKGKIDGKPINHHEVKKHFGKTIADGVEGLSNIHPGGKKLDLADYCHKILAADAEHPQLQLPVLKVMADRMLNYFDPVITPVPEGAIAARRKKTNDPSGPITKVLLADNKYRTVRQTVARAAQISRQTLDQPRFNPAVWARRVLR